MKNIFLASTIGTLPILQECPIRVASSPSILDSESELLILEELVSLLAFAFTVRYQFRDQFREKNAPDY